METTQISTNIFHVLPKIIAVTLCIFIKMAKVGLKKDNKRSGNPDFQNANCK